MTQEITAGHSTQLDFDSLSPAPGDDPVTSVPPDTHGENPPRLPPAPETVVPPAPSEETAPTLSDSRAARLRRIVRDGEEIARRLDRLRDDLQGEIPEVYRPLERGAARAADLLEDIAHAFDKAAFFARGQGNQAADRLTQAKQPVRFTRLRTPQKEAAAGEGTQPPPLWEVFASGHEDGQEGDADRSGDHDERERERPPWKNL